ncbi:EpsG family protein [Butyrivibrio fibrisolvens]|uniref:EpsG family protein n=1 Tax=Butyrivibrio fibrisolvens TaxID=831 RepID=UPI00040561D3|nr:EpsG family protein [Butyrivibrio fibrisolvens]
MGLFFSITIYCSVFALSSIFFPTSRSKNKYWLWGLLSSLFIPSLIAGIRALSVGKDINTYAVYVFSFFGLSDVSIRSIFTSASPLFALLAMISGRISSNIHLFLFFIEVFALVPVYIVYFIWPNKNGKYSILLFLLLFYNYSLNIMRQSISAGFAFAAFYLFDRKKYVSSIVFAVIAYGFHNTAIIYFLIIICFIAFDKFIAFKKKAIINVLYIVVVEVLLFSFLVIITDLLMKLGILNEVLYNRYYSILVGRNIPFSRLMIFELAFRSILIIYIVVCLVLSNNQTYDKENNMIAYLSLFGLITYCMAVLFLRTSVAYRFTQNFDYCIPLYIAGKSDCIKIIIGRDQSKILIAILFFLHWILAYILIPSGMGFGTEYYRFGI